MQRKTRTREQGGVSRKREQARRAYPLAGDRQPLVRRPLPRFHILATLSFLPPAALLPLIGLLLSACLFFDLLLVVLLLFAVPFRQLRRLRRGSSLQLFFATR